MAADTRPVFTAHVREFIAASELFDAKGEESPGCCPAGLADAALSQWDRWENQDDEPATRDLLDVLAEDLTVIPVDPKKRS